MQSEIELWNQENVWLNAFAETFFKDTRRMVLDAVIDADGDGVVICGRTRCFYAVQLAIHSVQTFNRNGTLFRTTRLILEVNAHPLELSISHPCRPVPVTAKLQRFGERIGELTFA